MNDAPCSVCGEGDHRDFMCPAEARIRLSVRDFVELDWAEHRRATGDEYAEDYRREEERGGDE